MEPGRHTADLAKTWERFVSGAEVDLSRVRPEVAASWRRCRAMRVPPDRNRAPQAPGVSSPLDEDLARASGPVVSFLNDALVGEGTLIDLANGDAKLLLTVGGNRALDAAARINGLPGSLWNEREAGTTVIGTGIVCRKPLAVSGYEHYVEEWHKWTCCSAPIFHPFQGALIGVLAIAGYREAAHPRAIELTIHASGLITDILRRLESQRRLLLTNAFEEYRRRYPDAAVVALDASGYLVQADSRIASLLRLSGPAAARRLAEVAGFEALAQLPSLSAAGQPQEFAVDLPGVSAAVAHPVSRDSRVVGSVLLLAPPKTARRVEPSTERWTTRFSFANIVGKSDSLQEAARTAARAAATDYPVLLVGESGTGKELFAHAIHDAAGRRNGPFVAFNCGTLSSELAVAEMCGYEPGSFTGADRRTRRGVLDMAHGGTLFLDELQDMDAKAQSLLLRFLETGTYVRVGGTQPVKADVRVIAASNVPAAKLEAEHFVRPDLLYRLNCITIEIPPLRERPEDIRPIGEECLRRDLHFTGEVDEAVWETLRACDWPGNVRQLSNVLLRATLVCSGNRLTVEDLPRALMTRRPESRQEPAMGSSDEIRELKDLLRSVGGDVREAARRLGVHRATLYRRMSRAGIKAR